MDEQLSSNDKEKSTTDSSSLQITHRRDSSRTLSPVAFFHDGIIINKTDLHNNLMEIQRRAQAIATAPRRKRFDDDKEEIEQNKTLLGSITTSALPIPLAIESQHPHSLPQTQSGTNLLPKFRIDPPSQDNSEQLDYTFNQNSRRNRSPSVP